MTFTFHLWRLDTESQGCYDRDFGVFGYIYPVLSPENNAGDQVWIIDQKRDSISSKISHIADYHIETWDVEEKSLDKK